MDISGAIKALSSPIKLGRVALSTDSVFKPGGAGGGGFFADLNRKIKEGQKIAFGNQSGAAAAGGFAAPVVTSVLPAILEAEKVQAAAAQKECKEITLKDNIILGEAEFTERVSEAQRLGDKMGHRNVSW